MLDQSNLPRIRSRSFGPGEGDAGFDHGLHSVLVLERWLWQGELPPIAKPLARAVGAHHGRFHQGTELQCHRAKYKKYDARLVLCPGPALDWLATTIWATRRSRAAPGISLHLSWLFPVHKRLRLDRIFG